MAQVLSLRTGTPFGEGFGRSSRRALTEVSAVVSPGSTRMKTLIAYIQARRAIRRRLARLGKAA